MKLNKETVDITHPLLIQEEWDFNKNHPLVPSMFIAGSNKSVWWYHRICNQTYQAQICHRAFGRSNCPYCAGFKAYEGNCLVTKFPTIAAEWHPNKNGSITPYNTTWCTHSKVWWKCNKADDHEWEAIVSNRTFSNRGCPYCSNKKVTLSNCLATTHPMLTAQWHPTKNGDLTPYDIVHGREKPVWWICTKKHEWRARAADRSNKNNPKGCPICRSSKGELIIKQYLDQLSINYERQYTMDGCKSIRKLPFDFALHLEEGLKLIEFNGQQHYEYRPFLHDTKEEFLNIQKRDIIKYNWALENNIPLLVIPYWEKSSITKLVDKFIEVKSCNLN